MLFMYIIVAMNKIIITVISILIASPFSFAADTGGAVALPAEQGTARYSAHLPSRVGMLSDSFPALDAAVMAAFQQILSNTAPRTIRILEVGPGEGKSSATFRLLSALMRQKIVVNEGLIFEFWHAEPCDGHRANLETHWSTLAKVLALKKFPQVEYRLTRAKGQEFFDGDDFKELVAQVGESPFELIVSSNVLHFMSPEDQLTFSRAAAHSLAAEGQVIISTRGIHESEEYLRSAPTELGQQIRLFQAEFAQRMVAGETMFAGFFKDYYQQLRAVDGVGSVYHSAQTMANLFGAEGLQLSILSSEDLLSPFVVSRAGGDSIQKKNPSVLIVARKNSAADQ